MYTLEEVWSSLVSSVFFWIVIFIIVVEIVLLLVAYGVKRRQNKIKCTEINNALRESEERIQKIFDRMAANRTGLLESIVKMENMLQTPIEPPLEQIQPTKPPQPPSDQNPNPTT